jgi:hypothetical protein
VRVFVAIATVAALKHFGVVFDFGDLMVLALGSLLIGMQDVREILRDR